MPASSSAHGPPAPHLSGSVRVPADVRIVKLLSGLLGVVVLLAAAAPAAAGAYEPCPNDGKSYSWSGESVAEPVSIPSLTQPDGITAYDGAMWRPADSVAYPGKRPVVLLQHGLGGNKCRLAWVARYVAGHGYVAVTWTAPTGAGNGQSFVHAFDAMNSALAWMRTPANPQLAISDTDRITVGGGSLGSIVTSYVQGLGDPGIKAALAFDNLRRWISGDPGAAAGECEGAPTVEVTPTVPALGFAKDEPCNALPDVTDPDIKIKGGFDWWRANGVPSMVLSMAGYSHGDLTAGNGGEQKNLQVIHYVDAWLRLWIEGDQSAVADLLSPTVAGRPTTDFLSTNYLSGAYLPGTVDTTDFATWLRRDVTPPSAERRAGPSKRIERDLVRRKGIKFRFGSDDPAARFECRFDKQDWRSCKSPKIVKRAKVGRHTFRMRAIDPSGNSSPIKRWKFKVVR